MRLQCLSLVCLVIFSVLQAEPTGQAISADPRGVNEKAISALDLRDAIAKAVPAVVFIANEQNGFDDFFHPSPDSYIESLRPFYELLWPPIHSHGSGFIVSPQGHIITNAHVVADATYTFVALIDEDTRILKAEVLGIDQRTDLAVLRIDSGNEERTFPYLSLGDSDHVQIGQEIAILGNPLGPALESTVTKGIISGISREGFDLLEIEEFLQTDSAINPGNSGGPAINDKGEVIGIAFGGFVHYESLHFLIPSQIAKKIFTQIIDRGKIASGYLGISTQDVKTTVFDAYTFQPLHGAFVEQVASDSPAENAGIQVGDWIIAINGHSVRSSAIFEGQLALIPPHARVTLWLIRGGETLEVSTVLEEWRTPSRSI